MVKAKTKRTRIILIAVIISIVLYLAGVMSGLYANKILERQTEANIQEFKEETRGNITRLKAETEKELAALQNYTQFLEENLRTMQLEQLFLDTLTRRDMCNFSTISLSQRFSQLSYFWERLPFRMEEFEAKTELSEEYLLLKSQYTDLSIRTWILAKNQYERCNTSLVQGIYFYSADCTDCVAQGEELDALKKVLQEDGREALIFTLDFNAPDPMLSSLQKYYGIKETPSLIINNRVYQGRVFTFDEIYDDLQRGQG
ncbi:MAG: hypothetical protein ABIJ21_00765 [Nanoarchaeota archaeon]